MKIRQLVMLISRLCLPEWGGRDSNPRPMDYESTALTG